CRPEPTACGAEMPTPANAKGEQAMNTTTAAHGSVPARGRHHAVEIAAIFVRILGGGLAIALALGALVLLLAAPAHAVEMQATPMHPSEAGQGTLLMRAPDG